MRSTLLGLILLLLLLPAGLAAPCARAGEDEAPASAKDDHVFPLSAVRPGLVGTAHTVFAGTRIETFDVEVIDVLHNFLTKQDVILVKCLGDRAALTGVAEGMSGSPVTIDGKIVGALAYTWEWVKQPYGGITPLETMIQEASRPSEGRPSGAEPPTSLRPPPPRPIAAADADGLVPIATPVCVSGFSPEGCARLKETFEDLGMPVRVGGGLVAGAPAGWSNLDAPLVPGCVLTVDLVRGDFSVNVLGTCTYVDGDRIYAFGHGFQGVGETLFPLSVGYVYSIIPRQAISFKIGASIREVGALTQDRQSGIAGVVGMKAPMVPFHVRLANAATGQAEEFHYEVTANRILFQRLLLMTLREAFSRSERTLSANTKSFRLTVKLKGLPEAWSYEDDFVSFDTGLSRILITLVDRVLNHPTERAEFESIDLDVKLENVDRRGTIEKVTASRDEVRRGEQVDLLVRVRLQEGGTLLYEHMPFRVPADAPEGNLSVTVTGGGNVAADVATPVDILDIPKLYAAFYKSKELVAIVPTGRVNLDMNGRLLRNLPLSAVARLARSPDAAQVKVQPVTEKVRQDVPYIVWGAGKVSLRVVR